MFLKATTKWLHFHQSSADVFFATFSPGPVEDHFHLRLIVIFQHAEYFVEFFERP